MIPKWTPSACPRVPRCGVNVAVICGEGAGPASAGQAAPSKRAEICARGMVGERDSSMNKELQKQKVMD